MMFSPLGPNRFPIPIDTSNSVQGAMLDTNGLYPVAFTLARTGLETPGDACEDVPWLLLWSSFVSWAFHPNRPDDIPGYVLHILALYIWYLGKGDCPRILLASNAMRAAAHLAGRSNFARLVVARCAHAPHCLTDHGPVASHLLHEECKSRAVTM